MIFLGFSESKKFCASAPLREIFQTAQSSLFPSVILKPIYTMNTNDEHNLSHQQQRFCDEYLVHFNAFKAAVNAGYSENTARKGELLHLPKVQYYLQDAMRKTQSRLQITHDMILSELAKIAFSNMGNYYDEYAVLKPMNQLTNDEKAAISQYQIMDAMDNY